MYSTRYDFDGFPSPRWAPKVRTPTIVLLDGHRNRDSPNLRGENNQGNNTVCRSARENKNFTETG